MQPDQALVLGILLAIVSIPSIISAYSDQRAPRVSAAILMIGGGLIVWALQQRSYTFAEIPEAIFRVIGSFLQ